MRKPIKQLVEQWDHTMGQGWEMDLQLFGPGAAAAGSGIGDILGIVGAISQQNAQKGIANQVQGLVGQETGEASSLFGDYQNFTLPGLQDMISTLTPEQQQAWSSAITSLGSVGSSASALTNNPYLSPTAGIAQQLTNFNPLTTSQLNELSTQAGGAAQSAAKTARAQMGGVANPAALYQQLINQAGGVSDQAAVSLGSQDAAARLNALTAGGSLLNQVGSQYLTGNQGAGQLSLGSANTSAGMSTSALDSILQSFGLTSQTLPYATSLLQGGTNTLAGTLSGMSGSTGLPGLFGGLGSSLTQLFPGGSSPGGGTPSPGNVTTPVSAFNAQNVFG
jgi:hypothetical protein